MKVRKPIFLNQFEIVTAIQDSITNQNQGLVFEFDLTMLNPIINAVDQMIGELKAQGDYLYNCDCKEKHDKECHLYGAYTYSVKERYDLEYKKLCHFIYSQSSEYSYLDMFNYMNLPSNTFKAILSECMSDGLLYRKENEFFETSQTD